MSLNRKVNLKLVRGDEIRILHVVPNTWAEFQAALRTMYGSSDFQITYIDEENDHITIANNLDLNEALLFCADKPSMKLFLKPLQALEEQFEELKVEDTHRPPTENKPKPCEEPTDWSRGCGEWGRGESGRGDWGRGWGGRGRCRGRWANMWRNFMQGDGEQICSSMQKHMRKMFKKNWDKKSSTYKAKVLQPNFPKQWVVSAGTTVQISWSVVNRGKTSWPAGTVLEAREGTIQMLQNVCLAEVRPGEVVEIILEVQVPSQQGKHKGFWAILVAGEVAGILKAKFYASAETNEAKVQTLLSMGFNRPSASQALDDARGDLDLAISKILRSDS